MDVCEPEKHAAVDTPRPSFAPAERNNAVTTWRPRTREVSSRYKSPSPSPSPSTPSKTRRSPSPNLTRTVHSNSLLVPKRAVSAERNRPSTPLSPQRPSTPIRDSSVDSQLSSRRMSIGGGRLPESLWPSTMRSLGVSFQPDIISIHVSKKEKPVNSASLDRTLRPSSNVGHKPTETPSRARKPTPDRKRSPLKGRNSHDQSENAKPVDGLHSRLIDQHRWPSRMHCKLSSSSLNRSVDFTDKSVGNSAIPSLEVGLSSWRRTPTTDSMANPLEKSFSDADARLLLPDEIGRVGLGEKSIDDSSLQFSVLHNFVSPSLSDKTMLATPVAKSQSLPTTRSRPASPSRTSGISSSIVKGLSPSRTRPSTPPSRVSPSRIRPSSSSSQASNSTSVLSFIVDFKKGKRGASYIEDVHHLRLIYNRYLQWRFVNARAEAVIYAQKVNAEKTLYNAWNTTLSLWDSIIRKSINLQQLKLNLKLNSVLNDQMGYLDDWGLLEREHISSLTGAVYDLEASTLRLPVTGGATANIESLKIAICSAVDVMQAMGSSICSLLSRVEGINTLVSELAVVAAQEKAMLDECEALLASTAAKQVEEYSFRTNLIQTKQALLKDVNFLGMNISA